MPNYTPNFNLVKPAGTEQFDEANDNSNMDIIDTQLKNLTDALDARLDVLEADSGDVTNNITASAGWTVSAIRNRKIGKLAIVSCNFQKTGSGISGTSDGNIANVEMGVIAAGWRPHNDTALGATSTGIMYGGYINEAGQIVLSALPPGQGVSVGDILSVGVTILVAN